MGGPERTFPALIQDAGVGVSVPKCARQPAVQQGLGAISLICQHWAMLNAGSKTCWEVVMWARTVLSAGSLHSPISMETGPLIVTLVQLDFLTTQDV